jgi:hypothetical protein
MQEIIIKKNIQFDFKTYFNFFLNFSCNSKYSCTIMYTYENHHHHMNYLILDYSNFFT